MTKKFLPIFLLVFLLIGLADTSLSAQRKCGSQILHHEKMHNDPVYRANFKAYEKAMQKSLNTSSARANCTEAKFFPVAIHFDWTPTATEQVELIKLAQNQIATLNASYNGGDCGGGTNSGCYEFFLATHGHPTGSGVTEGEPAVTFGGTAGADYCEVDGYGDTQPCNLTSWIGYLNITVNRLAGTKMCTSLGVSHLAGNPITMNSMSVNACAFGSTGIQSTVADATGGANCSCLATTINGGATVVHEIGHFLGLFHTFCVDNADKGPGGANYTGSVFSSSDIDNCQQPSVCGSGCVTLACDCDMVTDTQAQAFSSSGCPGGSAAGTINNFSTGMPEAFNNFMDYSDDACMSCFSEGQYTRMATTLASPMARASDYKTKASVTAPECSITNATISNFICDGDDAIASINFTAINGTGNIEVLFRGETVIGSGAGGPILVTVPGPRDASNGKGESIIIRYENDTDCGVRINGVRIPACPTPTAPPPSISDPCSCSDGMNQRDAAGIVTRFHDVLTVTGTGGDVVVLKTGAASFSDAAGVQIPDGTDIGPIPPSGTLDYDFYHDSGVTGSIVLTIGGIDTAPFDIMACDAAACPLPAAPIPTMSEWGLLIFGLLVLNLGVFTIRRGRLNTNNNVSL